MTGAACEADLQRVYAEEIILLPDQDMVIVLRAVPLEPDLPAALSLGRSVIERSIITASLSERGPYVSLVHD
jgi:hypothetical protein